MVHGGQRFVVTDTAGIRRKATISTTVESYSVVRAMKAMDDAEVVAVMLDATEAGVDQDAKLLGLVLEKAKALVVVVNKWDVAEQAGATQDWYRQELDKRLPFVAFAPMVFVSAREGKGVRGAPRGGAPGGAVPRPLPHAPAERAARAHPGGAPGPVLRRAPGQALLRQHGVDAPPTFVLNCGRPETIGDCYRRYVENRFRQAFGLRVPMRLVFRERARRGGPRRAKSKRRGA